VKNIIKQEDLTLQEGVDLNITLDLSNAIPMPTPEISKSHAILIEIQSFPSNPDAVNMEHVIDVYARMNVPGHLSEFIDIKDTFPVMREEDDAQMIYHYLIYDTCYITHTQLEPPTIELRLRSLSGQVNSRLDARVVEFKNLKMN
jgi:hypothetical protein